MAEHGIDFSGLTGNPNVHKPHPGGLVHNAEKPVIDQSGLTGYNPNQAPKTPKPKKVKSPRPPQHKGGHGGLIGRGHPTDQVGVIRQSADYEGEQAASSAPSFPALPPAPDHHHTPVTPAAPQPNLPSPRPDSLQPAPAPTAPTEHGTIPPGGFDLPASGTDQQPALLQPQPPTAPVAPHTPGTPPPGGTIVGYGQRVEPAKWTKKEYVDKELPTPDVDTYAKDVRPDWRIVGASIRGRGHELDGKYREDAMQIASVDGWDIVAVADGGGSYEYSRVGANAAVKAAVKAMEDRINTTGVSANEDELKQLILSGAQAAYDSQPLAAQQSNQYFRNKNIQRTDKKTGQVLPDITVKDLRPTLLLFVHRTLPGGTHLVGSFQVGDGAIYGRDANGNLHRISNQTDTGPQGNETTFLSDENPDTFENRIRINKDADKHDCHFQGPNCHFLVMTDGISDDFDENHVNLLEGPLFGTHFKASDPAKEVEGFIRYPRQGSFDDRTLVVLGDPQV